MEADIIFMAVSIFRSANYFERFAAFGATHDLPNKGERYFRELHAEGMENIERFVGILQEEGAEALQAAQQKAFSDMEELKELHASKKHAYADTLHKRGQREVIRKPVPKAESAEAADEEEAETKPKQKAASKKVSHKQVKSEPTAEPEQDHEEEDEEEEDEEEVIEKPKKKQKTSAKKVPAAKRKGDMFGLGSKEVRKDWRQMKSPPLEIFHFKRKVVDEFTYLDKQDVPTIQAIKA